jgi:hypothetical protein
MATFGPGADRPFLSKKAALQKCAGEFDRHFSLIQFCGSLRRALSSRAAPVCIIAAIETRRAELFQRSCSMTPLGKQIPRQMYETEN